MNTLTTYARQNGKTFQHVLAEMVNKRLGAHTMVAMPLYGGQRVSKEQQMEMFLLGGTIEEFDVLGMIVKAMHYKKTLYVLDTESRHG